MTEKTVRTERTHADQNEPRILRRSQLTGINAATSSLLIVSINGDPVTDGCIRAQSTGLIITSINGNGIASK